MPMALSEIARRIGAALEGDGSVVIGGLAGIADAKQGDVTFLANPRYSAAVAATKASAIVVGEDWKGAAPCAVIRAKNPDRAFSEIAALLVPPPVAPAAGVHPTAVVAPGASLGPGVSVGPCAVIEPGAKVGANSIVGAQCYVGHDAVIGEQCRLYPQVSVRERVRIGNRVIIHNGAVIGSDGFGYYRDGAKWVKIAQVGTVEIGDDVEIGANVTVDRARFGTTVIAAGAKIDNLVQIAHNVRIGENTAMAAQVGISGSTSVGRNVQIGGQAGLAGHIEVGDFSVVGAQAGVTKDVPPKTFVSGYPAMPHDEARKLHVHVKRLPELKQKVAELEKRLQQMERGLGATQQE